MHHLSLASALAASLILGACASPSQVAQAPNKPAGAAMAANNDQNPEICAKVEDTGSRLPAKECHTASEWAALRSRGNDDLNNRTTLHAPTTGGN